MSQEISGGTWTAVGRLCVDGGFAQSLFDVTHTEQQPKPKPEDSEALAHLLNDVLGFAIFIDDIVVLHLILWKLRRDGNISQSIGKSQTRYNSALGSFRLPSTPRTSNFYAAIGLACIDGTYRAELEDSSKTQAAFETQLDKPPGFVPADEEKPVLRALFGDEEFRTGIEKTHDLAWRDPFIAYPAWPRYCKQRLRFAKDYVFIDTPTVVNMVHSLYLGLHRSGSEEANAMFRSLHEIHTSNEISEDPLEQVHRLAVAVGLDPTQL